MPRKIPSREPKNSMVKQYKKLLMLDNVELEIEEDAYREIARLTIERETGSRGLRSIIERIMLKPMFEIPSDPTVRKLIITADAVKGTADPIIVRE